jgi:hypothetical protein
MLLNKEYIVKGFNFAIGSIFGLFAISGALSLIGNVLDWATK